MGAISTSDITVCIFAWNEEGRILRCIRNFIGLFNVIVVDNFSSDNTFQVVVDAGFRAIRVKNPGFIETPEVMDRVIAECNTSYILIASVSEVVPLKLLRLYEKVAKEKKYDVVRAFRISVTAGLVVPISGVASSRAPGEIRFFRRDCLDYSENKVHGRGKPTCSPDRILRVVENTDLNFFQFRDYDWSHTEMKHRGYNDLLAKQMFDSGIRFRWHKVFYHASKQFFNAYIRFGSWRLGTLGFIHSFHRAYMELGIWFRVWEWQHGFDRAGVIFRNDEFRIRLEREIFAENDVEHQ